MERYKKLYNAFPFWLRWIVVAPVFLRLWGPSTIRDFIKGQPFTTWRARKKSRGMSPMVDVVDWVGGWPFEVSKPEEIFYFFQDQGFYLEQLRTCTGGHGCNEYVFRAPSSSL